MSPAKYICRFTVLLVCVLMMMVCANAQGPTPEASPQPVGSGISLAPARLELEMQPGSETTVVVNLDYHNPTANSQAVRIVASLNDWTIDRDGQVHFSRANTLPNSASPWLIYSPAETTVMPAFHRLTLRIAAEERDG